MREETKTGGVRIRMREMVKWRVDAGIGVLTLATAFLAMSRLLDYDRRLRRWQQRGSACPKQSTPQQLPRLQLLVLLLLASSTVLLLPAPAGTSSLVLLQNTTNYWH